MSRTNGEGRLKKRNCCLTCSIICFILLIIFIVALYVGGTILFKTYVSPHIGGLGLNDAIALAANVLSGKEAETTYTEDDLDDFYSGLSDAFFLADKTENELEYELVPKEKRAELAPAAPSVSAAAEDGDYDEDAAYDAFCLKLPAERYALLSDETRALLSLEEYSALAAATDDAKAARDKVGLKMYRLSAAALMEGMDFTDEDMDYGKAIEKTLSSLEFNFDSLENYDIYNAAASQNEKFTTFSVTGNQASAFINDVIDYLLAAEGSPLTSMLKDYLPMELPLADYVTVSSVTIMNTPLATRDGEAIYDQKDTALGIAISIRLRDIVKAALATEELRAELAGVPSFAIDLIPSLVPHFFSANVTVYPLAPASDGREIILSVNNGSEKNTERLSILLNALLGEGEDASRSFFGTINDEVSEAFSSINETVKINFVPTKDAEGQPLKDEKGNTYSAMRIMTWQTLLSILDDEGRLSDHDMLTMLKCLYIAKELHTKIDTDTSMDSFKEEMAEKYGMDKTYLDENNILDPDNLSGMADHINLGGIELKEDNEAMRVHLDAKALAAFMADFISGEDDTTSAAEEESSLLEGLDLTITDVSIDKVSEEGGVAIYSFELGVLIDLNAMLENLLPEEEGIVATIAKKLLPKNDAYLCAMMYISEYVDAESGKLMHKVGKNIDSPDDSAASNYLSKVRINDFSYADTERVLDALNVFMETLAGEAFDIDSIIGDMEDTVNEIFDSLTDADFKVDLRLYQKDDATGSLGGLTLPSVYELLKSVVEPKLGEEETFELSDARNVIAQIFHIDDVEDEIYYEAAQADDLMDEINDKYYIKKASALSVSDLFGDSASDLSSKIGADSIYFKPDAEEAALWESVKRALYSDTRSITDLRIRLSGTQIAALVEESGMIPKDIASDFGEVEVLGAKFETIDEETFLIFDLKLVKKEDDSELQFGGAFPSFVKISARVLLHAPSYTEARPRYTTLIDINDKSSQKAFILLRALGGEDLSEKAIGDRISESLATTFNTLEGTIPLYYTEESGDPYYLGSEECILISDVFSFLVKETDMKDLPLPAEAAAPEVKAAYAAAPNTDAQELANRLRGFGQQATGDSNNAGVYTWLTNVDPFVYSDDGEDANDSDAYIYKNMKDAYFMKNDMSLNNIYGDGAFNSQFGEIKTVDFNLKDDENGLFYYDGEKKLLKISDKALGAIIKKKQKTDANLSFAGAVAGAGMTPEIISLKLTTEGDDLAIECGVKIAFAQTGEHSADYVSMPAYFFVISRTVRHNEGGGVYSFSTSLTMNNLETTDTDKLFYNIQSLKNKGINADSFNKEDITDTINDAIKSAFNNLPSNVSFGSFTASDISSVYQTSTALAPTVYPEGCILPTAGDGYISFPSIYSYLLDIFYPEADGGWPEYDDPEEKLQHMLLSLHAADASTAVITNEKDEYAYHVDLGEGYISSSLDGLIIIYSDKYFASVLNGLLSTQSLNSDISMNDALRQTIILPSIGEHDDPGERASWADKFYTTSDPFVYNKDYIIATVVVSLDGYSTGNADLLPAGNTLCFTVLVDLTTPADSLGLLYNMDYTDMEIFEHIISNNASFNINDIAAELAGKIKDHMDAFNVSGFPAALEYHLTGDSFYYSDEIMPLTLDQDAGALNDGIGYLVLKKA